MRSSGECITIQQAIDELIASKTAANRRPAYISGLKVFLRKFSKQHASTPIEHLNCHAIESWMSSHHPNTPPSRQQAIKLLSVLFGFARRRGYVSHNPCERIERVTIDQRPPRILTPREARKILNFTRRKMRWRLAHLVIGLYCGVRPAELERLYWRDVNLDRGFICIDTAAAKTRRRRIVYMDSKAVAWLRKCRVQNVRPIGAGARRWKRRVLEQCGVEWSQDLLRHTAASYLMAKHRDPGKVSGMLGNSADILLTRYYELVSPQDCRRFWKTWRNQ